MREFFLFSLLLTTNSLLAQGPISGFMPGRGHTDIALSYSYESYDTYKFGNESQDISTITRSASLFLERGLTDTMSLVFTLPYLVVDHQNRGFQDGILVLKYRNAHQKPANGQRSWITSVGVSTPLSAYPVDTERPIGIRATVFQGRFLIQQQWNMGLFLHLQTGFDFRIIPDAQAALPVVARIGWAGRRLYLESWMEWQHAFQPGVDERIGAGTGSSWQRIGGTIYYALHPQLGVLVGGAKFLNGRNIGLANRVNVGVVYKGGEM